MMCSLPKYLRPTDQEHALEAEAASAYGAFLGRWPSGRIPPPLHPAGHKSKSDLFKQINVDLLSFSKKGKLFTNRSPSHSISHKPHTSVPQQCSWNRLQKNNDTVCPAQVFIPGTKLEGKEEGQRGKLRS